jgi:hypothetical protein
MKENSSNSAFPSPQSFDNQDANGLTKREYFAGLALQGLLASNKFDDIAHSMSDKVWERREAFNRSIAIDAVHIADEILNCLNK